MLNLVQISLQPTLVECCIFSCVPSDRRVVIVADGMNERQLATHAAT